RGAGGRVPIEYSVFRVVRGGVAAGAVVSFADLSERERLEGQLRQAQKMEAVGRLAGGVAHDFNNLLTVINGCAELVLTHKLPAEMAKKFLEDIRTAGDRAAALTQQLLIFSRRQVVVPQTLDLNAVVADT